MGQCLYDFQCMFGMDNAGSDCKHCPYYKQDEDGEQRNDFEKEVSDFGGKSQEA